MSEYIVCIPSTLNRDGVYYPDERNDPMPVYEEIVRCRDCVNYKPYKTYRHGTVNRCHDENGNTHRRDDSDFCSWGARREQ